MLNDLYKKIYLDECDNEMLIEFDVQIKKFINKAIETYRHDYHNVDELFDACWFDIMIAVQKKNIDINMNRYSFTSYCMKVIQANCNRYYKGIKNDWDVIAYSLDEELQNNETGQRRIDFISNTVKDRNKEILDVVLKEMQNENKDNPAFNWFLQSRIGGYSNIEIAKEAKVSDSYVSREINKVFLRVKKECLSSR